MGTKNVLAKVLAVIGTILVWFPLLAMLFFGVLRYFQGAPFVIDYLLPAELLPVWFVGALALIVAAILARKRRALIGLSLLAGIVLIVVSQLIAVVSGLASGAIPPAGLPYYVVLGGIIGYDISLIVTGNAGISLIRDLFMKAPVGTPPAPLEAASPAPAETTIIPPAQPEVAGPPPTESTPAPQSEDGSALPPAAG